MGGHFIHDNQNIYHNPVRGAQSSGFQQLATIDWSTKPSVTEGVIIFHSFIWFFYSLIIFHSLIWFLLSSFFFFVNFLLLYMYFFGKLFWGNILLKEIIFI